MPPQHADETWHVRYLLGRLTEEEQAQVEDRAFADADYLSALESVEADLIDAYVRGELAPADRRRFEHRFLTVPERRRKVEFARALSTMAAEAADREPQVAERPFFARAFRGWTPGLQLAAGVAALICIAGGAWLVSDNAASRSRVAALEAERRGFDEREARLRQQLGDEQARAAALAAQTRQPADVERTPLVASLILVPGVSRAPTRVEQLVLSPTTQIARIEMPLEARDDYPRYRAELRTKSGEEVLSQSNLARRKSGAGFAVVVDVPASALAGGDYELTLTGIAADRSSQDVGYYYFGVQRR